MSRAPEFIIAEAAGYCAEPCCHTVSGRESYQRTPCANESLPGNILSLVRVIQDPRTNPQNHFTIPVHNYPEGIRLAIQHPFYYFSSFIPHIRITSPKVKKRMWNILEIRGTICLIFMKI